MHIVYLKQSIHKYFIKHRSFIIYSLVGAGISGVNIVLLYLLIDIFKISTVISSTIVVGGTFIFKYYVFKWTGFAK